MVELVRTNDPVQLSWAQAVLEEAGISSVVFDVHTSVIEGSIGAIPRRLMVDSADESRAKRVLQDAGRELDGQR
jgi:Putative prokaryotic signal transducing protein